MPYLTVAISLACARVLFLDDRMVSDGRTLETLRGCEADSRDACGRDESIVFAGAVDDEDPTVQSQEHRESGNDGEADRHAQNGRRVGMA